MIFFVSCILSLFFLVHGGPAEGKTERDLRQDLFEDYDKLVRPVRDPTHAIPAKLSIAPLALGNVYEDYNVLTLNSWLLLTWTDEYLQWDPSEYSGITVLNVPATELWRPDIALYNAATDDALFPQVFTQTLIYHNGTVIWVPPFTLKSKCPVEGPSFNKNPSTKSLECVLKLGSWTYSDVMVDINKYSEEVDLTNFQDTHPLYKLLSVTSKKESKHYPCCPESYSTINFDVSFKRRGSASPMYESDDLKFRPFDEKNPSWRKQHTARPDYNQYHDYY